MFTVDGPDVKIPIPDGFTTPKHSSEQPTGPTTENPTPVTDQTEAPTTKEPQTESPATDKSTDKPDPSGNFKCTAPGFFKDPKNSRK